MQHRANMLALVVIPAIVGSTACGSSRPAAGSSAVLAAGESAGVDLVGTLNGGPVAWHDAASAVVTNNGAQTLVVLVSDAAGVCAAVQNQTASNANLLVVRVAESAGAIAAGSHAITAAHASGEQVSVTLTSAGQALAAPTGAVAVSYTAADNSSPAVLVVTATDGNNTLSGSVSAPPCAALVNSAASY